MNGKRAKLYRKIAYGGVGRRTEEDPVMYQFVACPGQSKRKPPRTIIADEKRFMYQTLKGRRGAPKL